jgi:hypothetical protein
MLAAEPVRIDEFWLKKAAQELLRKEVEESSGKESLLGPA